MHVKMILVQFEGYIFTDGSKDPVLGKTGAGIFVADKNLQFSIRLSDNLYVFSAELLAILKAK